jgi:hypothetical protein
VIMLLRAMIFMTYFGLALAVLYLVLLVPRW